MNSGEMKGALTHQSTLICTEHQQERSVITSASATHVVDISHDAILLHSRVRALHRQLFVLFVITSVAELHHNSLTTSASRLMTSVGIHRLYDLSLE